MVEILFLLCSCHPGESQFKKEYYFFNLLSCPRPYFLFPFLFFFSDRVEDGGDLQFEYRLYSWRWKSNMTFVEANEF